MVPIKLKETAVKALTWRLAGSIITFSLVLLCTGSLAIAATVCCLEVAIKLALYYVHEQAWNRFAPAEQRYTPFVLWFTGLSGSGKSTIADRLYERLEGHGYRVTRLDGDTVRSVFPNTGFSRDERNTHIKRIGYLASILEKNGIIVIASFVSPYAESRDFVRGMCGHFIEAYIATSLEECERRDVKGLYKTARAGGIKNFTGLDDPYEPPLHPELTVTTEGKSIDESMQEILTYLAAYLQPETRKQ
jgi:adenylylsulfate kinase